MLVDSHCHLDLLDLQQYGGTLQSVLDFARESGVTHMLCVAVSLETYPRMRALVDPLPQVSVSVGLHPNETVSQEPDIDTLATLAADPRVVAVGETGLDYYRSDGDLEWQRERFRRHIAAARRVGKPVIVHSRAARADTLRILREEAVGDVGGVMHCFAEDWETARGALDLNLHISFSGIVTFKNAIPLKEVARQVPLDRMLVETDCPYLAPVPFRGRPNQPGYVRHVAEHIAELRGVSLTTIAESTTRNFQRLIGRP
ncbi:MAG: TatD family deoxyribonuclease [Chromatiales bacterium 21-64-14]|nr:MAG: TatD family deoxyribonuclease [Chromatiales bacterium 21-64-14]HQU16322.1 TatD family hydrolase [Gammaproteobacteria bacterium]